MSNKAEVNEVKSAIEALSTKAVSATDGGQAMHYSQAALNMANVRATLDNIGR